MMKGKKEKMRLERQNKEKESVPKMRTFKTFNIFPESGKRTM